MKVDYIALSIPVFFLLIAIELAYSFYRKLHYHRLHDSIANLSQGIGQQITGIFMKTTLFFGYKYIFENWRFFDLPQTLMVWSLLFIAVDFFYYWFHRMSHQVNALWAAHIVHHQSEEYNLTVALRQSWFQSWFSWVFYLPLAFLGFNPVMFLTLSAFNTLYQFWIHTRTIKTLGFLEYILNTPSHHRVHHGSNPKYIDKNHAGSLIIWDKMFGTFQKEEDEVYYGITTPLASWNPLWANFHYWVALWQTAKKSTTYKDKFYTFLKPPGWFPVNLGGFKYPEEINVNKYQKFDTPHQSQLSLYTLMQFIVALIVGAALLFLYVKFNFIQITALAIFTLATLITCGAVLENKSWLPYFEIGRILFAVLMLYFFKKELLFYTIAPIFITCQLLSLIGLFIIKKHLKHA